MVNNSMMAAVEACQEQQNRDALFTMEVARKNQRNALLTILRQRPVGLGFPRGAPARPAQDRTQGV
jgi:hypothetical protein